jgi:hypothetical protein
MVIRHVMGGFVTQFAAYASCAFQKFRNLDKGEI